MSTLTTNRAKDALKAYYGKDEEKKKKVKVKQAKKIERSKFVPAMEPAQTTGVN